MRRIHLWDDAENTDQNVNAIKLTLFRKQNKTPDGNSVNPVYLPRYEATKLPIASPLSSNRWLAF